MGIDEDAGEQWLLDHDPDYDGEVGRREIPWGSVHEIEVILDRATDPHRTHGVKARPIVSVASRACWWCEEMYVPSAKWQRHCSDRCRKRAFRAKQKGTHSDTK